jgi:hypothetical protein
LILMNKKGFTVVELIVSFALTVLVVGLLFQMLLSLKDVYVASGFKSQMVNKQTLMSSKINQDLNNNILKIALKCGDNCINFVFEDGTSKKLIVDDKNNIFSYGDYSTKLVNGSKFGNFYIRNEKIMGLDSTSNYDSVIEIKIPIEHPLLKEDFGVNMLYQYDSRTSSIADIIFDSSATTEDKIVFKGSSHMYHTNNTIFTDPGYFVYQSNGTIVDMSASVTKTGTVGTSVGTTYVLVYTLKDGSNNVIDVATREVTVVKGLYEYDFTGNFQTFNVPFDGTYQFEAWGSAGAYWLTADNPGRGGYTKGNLYLTKGTNVYIYVGGRQSAFNGGGIGGRLDGTQVGGGATDFRLTSGTWNNTTGLRSRIMVAGAGGGTGETVSKGGDAGGLTGFIGNNTAFNGGGALQTSGGLGAVNGTMSGTNGSFGAGGNGGQEVCCAFGGAGGGGYYGGGGAAGVAGSDGAGGGGSSFISGHFGVNAINASGVHTNSTVHYSGYAFFNTSMIAGNASMPNPRAAGNITGNTGNGYAKITVLSVINEYNDDTTAPVITLNGASTVAYVAGTTTAYSDLGATAIDNIDGDVSGNIVTTGSVPNQMGTYTITYTAIDSNGNTSVATRTVNVTQLQTEVLVVAGGGGGGSRHGGGGGSGGYIYQTGQNLLRQSYSAVVGAGGSGGLASSGGLLGFAGSNGQNSSFGSLISIGGGGGGSNNVSGVGLPGGSGGGGNASANGGAGTQSASSSGGNGNNGGAGLYSTYYMGGGGGGAGSVGGTAIYPNAGSGGAGISNAISGSNITYASGGNGGIYNLSSVALNGAPNTGSGGGGSGGETNHGGSGGSGIVIIRYYGAQKATGGTITSVGGYTIHTFTSSGTFIVN